LYKFSEIPFLVNRNHSSGSLIDLPKMSPISIKAWFEADKTELNKGS